MPKTSLQNSIIREKRKILLMDTALRLFASYGVDNVTIDNITDALEISHGLFYHYFKDKKDLLNQLLEKAKSVFNNFLENTFDEETSPYDFLLKFTQLIISALNDNDDKAYYIYLVLTLNFQKFFENVDLNHKRIYSLVEQIKKGQELGQFIDIEPTELLIVYFSCIEGMTYEKIKYRKQFVLPKPETIMNIFIKR